MRNFVRRGQELNVCFFLTFWGNKRARRTQQYVRDSLFFDQIYGQLTQQFPDQHVAVYLDEVVGHNKDLETLVASVHERGLPVGNVVFEPVHSSVSRPRSLIIPTPFPV